MIGKNPFCTHLRLRDELPTFYQTKNLKINNKYFYCADASGVTRGTGLGMSLVKEIMALHHGSVMLVTSTNQARARALAADTPARKPNK